MVHDFDLVSIIIPTKNEEFNIARCLQSIKSQEYEFIEIIVVDNFSIDKTVSIAKKFTPFVFQKGNERSAQRNFGAKKARGKYLLFLDADMRLTKRIISEAVEKAVLGNFIVAFPEKCIGRNFWEKSIAFERNLYQKERLLAAARFYPRKLFFKLAGFDEELIAGEDWDLTIRTQNLGYQLILTSSAINHYEEIKDLSSFLAKKHYYSQNIPFYAHKHPEIFAKQSNLATRLGIYLKNWQKLLANLTHTIGFLLLKALVWFAWRKYE